MIVGNSNKGIYANGEYSYNPMPTINNNEIHSNANYDLQLYKYKNPETVVDATHNWWGTEDGITLSKRIYDFSDAGNSAIADFVPFLDESGNPISHPYVQGVISTDTTWTAADSPYLIVGHAIVNYFTTLTVEPGTVVKFTGSYYLRIDGILNAQGTEDNRIVFTSNAVTPQAGDWHSIYFTNTSVDEDCILDYVDVEYSTNGVQCESASPTISNSAISYTTNYGIYANNGSSPIVSHNTINESTYGVYAVNSSPPISNNTIQNYASYGVYASGGFSSAISDNTFTQTFSYIGTGTGIYCENSSPTISGNTIEKSSIGVYCYRNSSPVISDNVIVGNSNKGIYAYGEYSYNPMPTINNNEIHSNANYDLQLYRYQSPETVVDATYNWWNSCNPEEISERIYDHHDDGNSAYADFEPFLCPFITNLSPISGPVGTLVTITGENFGESQDDSTVTFNGIDAGAADSWSDTEISIKVPEGATTGPVVVTVGGQPSNDDKSFTVISPTAPVITSISPSIGPVGTPVTITGENFGDSQDGSTVTFNDVDAGEASCWLGTKILIKVPEGAMTGPVVVTVGGQASNDDKIFTIGEVPPCSFADIDGDCDVDIVDIQKVAGRWNTGCGDGDYVPEYDVDGDGDIDIVDIQKVAGCWDTVLPSVTGIVATNMFELKPASPVQVSIKPRLQKLTISETTMIEVKIENVVNIGAFEVTLGYDNSVAQLATLGTQLGDFLSGGERTVAAVGPRIDENQSAFSYGAFSFGENPGPDGDGILATIPLTAQGEGQTMIKLMGVKLTDTDGKLIDVGKVKNGLVKVVPQETALAPNFPNPFNPDTWIPYQLSKDARVTIELYSVSGKLIQVLDLGYKEAGFYTQKSNAAYWDGRNQVGEKVASGVYFYHLKAGDFHATRKLLVTK